MTIALALQALEDKDDPSFTENSEARRENGVGVPRFGIGGPRVRCFTHPGTLETIMPRAGVPTISANTRPLAGAAAWPRVEVIPSVRPRFVGPISFGQRAAPSPPVSPKGQHRHLLPPSAEERISGPRSSLAPGGRGALRPGKATPPRGFAQIPGRAGWDPCRLCPRGRPLSRGFRPFTSRGTRSPRRTGRPPCAAGLRCCPWLPGASLGSSCRGARH